MRDEALGAAFELDERFVDAGFGRDEELPSAHFIASEPDEGRIAALALVTVRAEQLDPDEWQAEQVARVRASFAEWSPDVHEMLVGPSPASFAGRPAVHVRYRLLSSGARSDAAGAPLPDAEGRRCRISMRGPSRLRWWSTGRYSWRNVAGWWWSR